MALTEQIVTSQISVDEHGNVGVRMSRRFYDGDELIAEKYHRHVVAPDDPDDDEVPEVKAIRAAVVTPEKVAAAIARKADKAEPVGAGKAKA